MTIGKSFTTRIGGDTTRAGAHNLINDKVYIMASNTHASCGPRLREIEEENNAALKIQLAWRRKKGQMVLHMKRRIKAEARDAECWVVLFDYNAGGSYFFDYSSEKSAWHLPEKLIDTGVHTDEWIVCEDQRYRITYYYRMTDGSCHPMDDKYGAFDPARHGYANPPPIAKIALKSEHVPKQGKVTTDLAQAKYDLEQRQWNGKYYNGGY